MIVNMVLSSSLHTTVPSTPCRHQAVSVVLRGIMQYVRTYIQYEYIYIYIKYLLLMRKTSYCDVMDLARVDVRSTQIQSSQTYRSLSYREEL